MINICHIIDEKIILTEDLNREINSRIKEFANQLKRGKQSIDYYSKKRNVKAAKAYEDICLGKKAEYILAIHLGAKYNFPVLIPDIEIRKGNKKGWKIDLPYNEINSQYPNIHVKACSDSTLKFCQDYSWTFQYNNNNDKFGQDDLFKYNNNDLIAMMFLENYESSYGVIKAILPWEKLKKHLKNPLKRTLIGLKVCIYYKDLFAAATPAGYGEVK